MRAHSHVSSLVVLQVNILSARPCLSFLYETATIRHVRSHSSITKSEHEEVTLRRLGSDGARKKRTFVNTRSFSGASACRRKDNTDGPEQKQDALSSIVANRQTQPQDALSSFVAGRQKQHERPRSRQKQAVSSAASWPLPARDALSNFDIKPQEQPPPSRPQQEASGEPSAQLWFRTGANEFHRSSGAKSSGNRAKREASPWEGQNKPQHAGQAQGPRRNRRRKVKQDTNRIPFEYTPVVSTGPSLQQLKQESPDSQSTVTESELKAFQALVALSKNLTKVNGSRPSDARPLDAVVEEVLQKSTGLKIQATESNRGLENSQVPGVKTVGQGQLNRVLSLLMDAKSDVKAWQILEAEVIQPVLRSDLARGDKLDDPASAAASDLRPPTPNGSPQSISANDAQQIALDMFSEHLTNFQRVLRTNFPSSLYNIAVLPWLQRQGDAIFTVGATTDLYNNHLRQLLLKHYDIAAFVVTLQDMHSRVYDFDGETRDIVDEVLKEAEASIRPSRYGTSAMPAFWSTDHMRSLRQSLLQWRDVMEDQINERALRGAAQYGERTLQQVAAH